MWPAPAALPLRYSEYWLAVWGCALAAALVYGLARRAKWNRILGLALLTVPLWTAVWGFINSIPALTDGGSFRPELSTFQLSSRYFRPLLIDLGYMGTGFLLWTLDKGWPRSVRDLARRLRDEGVRWGPSEARSALDGWLLFPLLLAATAGLDWLVRSQAPALINGDETQIWNNMTVYHAVLISAAAAVTEELTYRVMVLLIAQRLLAAAGTGPRGALWGAVAAQGVVFGLAHGGYGTIYHVLGPLVFGLIAGVVAIRFGLWAAIMLHFLIDLYVFGAYAGENSGWIVPTLWVLLAINLVAMFAVPLARRKGKSHQNPA